MFYNGIELPAFPQEHKNYGARIPYLAIMPNGSVEDDSDLAKYAAEDKCSATS